MRVLQVLDVRWDSGIMRYGLSLAEAMGRRGHEVRAWALPGKPPYEEAKKAGLDVRRCDRPWLRFLELRADLQERPVDVINVHSGAGHTLAAGLIATLGKRPALVRTRGEARPLKARPGVGTLFRRTQAFIAGNEHIRSRFELLYGRACPSATVYWGLDWADMGPPPEGTLRVGVLARLDPVKGHSVLLQAAARLNREFPDAEFWLAGPEANLKAADLLRQAQALGLGARVHVPGRIGRVRNFLHECSVGVVASTGSEAVSRAAVEWMAAGRPLVASTVGCLPELVDDGVTGFLVPPRDPAALADALGRLLRDAELRRSMGRAARLVYESRFTADRFVKETLKVYEDALHRLPS